MGILTSMFTAVSGLSTYGNALGVIGNNIANVGTVGCKGSRSSFAELVSSSLSSSQQVGLGVRVASVDGNFSQGSLNTTGNTLDLAVNGDGFFQLQNSAGANFYSRAGQFQLDKLGEVVDPTGHLLQGYQATSSGVVTGAIGTIVLTTSNSAPQRQARRRSMPIWMRLPPRQPPRSPCRTPPPIIFHRTRRSMIHSEVPTT